jgi:outer membrane receptor protein involved in Fe transport
VAYDAGVERKFGRKLIGTVTVYKSHAKDYLAYLITSAGPPAIMTVENITSVNIHGVESELRYNLKDYFSISGDYTYNSSEIDKNPSNKTLEGQDLAYSPRHKYGMVFAYNNPAILSVMLAFHYESKSYADNRKELNEHSVWDIKLARKLTNFVSVEVNLENLFDKEYQVDHISTGSYLLAPGRLVTAGLKFAF